MTTDIQLGNRCGHDPIKPVCFIPPKEHKKRIPLQLKAIEKLEAYYSSSKKLLKSLNFIGGKQRQKRSERREAILAVSQLLVHYTDISGLIIGIPNDTGSYLGLSCRFIAKKLGWRSQADDIAKNSRGMKRVARALTDLKKAGYIETIITPKKIEKGRIVASGAIRRFTEKFFYELKITQHFLEMSQKIAKSQKGKKAIKNIKNALFKTNNNRQTKPDNQSHNNNNRSSLIRSLTKQASSYEEFKQLCIKHGIKPTQT